MTTPHQRRSAVGALKTHGVSERRACELASLHRSTCRYEAKKPNDLRIRARIKELAERHKRFGYRRIHVLLRRDHIEANHKKVYRIYREERLMLRSRRRKKLIVQRNRASAAMRPNQIWGLDFVFDTTESGRSLKCLVVLDEYTRYLITARIARTCTSADVIRTLEQSMSMHGEPECLRSDNGPEFTSWAMIAWTIQRGIRQCLITPGKPVENSFVESFNGTLRDEFLNENLFMGVRDAQ